MDILASTTFWVAIAFIAFFALIWFKGRVAIAHGIDTKINLIHTELQNATELKQQAVDALQEAKKQAEMAKTKINAIEKDAVMEADALKQKMLKQYDEYSKRKTQQTQERMAQIERSARLDLQNQMVDLSTKIAHHILEEQLQKNDTLIETSIQQVEKFS